jgi:hypothetical protein
VSIYGPPKPACGSPPERARKASVRGTRFALVLFAGWALIFVGVMVLLELRCDAGGEPLEVELAGASRSPLQSAELMAPIPPRPVIEIPPPVILQSAELMPAPRPGVAVPTPPRLETAEPLSPTPSPPARLQTAEILR